MRPVAAAAVLAAALILPTTALGAGVGGATWTPAEATTTVSDASFLVEGDAFIFRTESVWDGDQMRGLGAYLDRGLRYTHEVNDRSGRLSATGYWATNHPDPAYDRDDDDHDGRWEEAEVIAGAERPEVGRTYTSLVEFSRWHGKRERGRCVWAWDRRRGQSEVLSQLSRELLGEWQAERYTLSYDWLDYPRVGTRPDLPSGTPSPLCRDELPGTNQSGFVITFSRPLRWAELNDLVSVGSRKWTAFEAVGSSRQDDRVWTCGGPVDEMLRFRPCRKLGVRVDGISAAVGYFDPLAIAELRDYPVVAAVSELQDTLTGLLYDVGGFGIEPPGLTVNDRYWELVLTD